MLRKFETFLKMKEQFGLSTAIELTLFRLGLRKQHVINYPISSLTIRVDKGPLTFWKRLERGTWEINLIRFISDLVKPGETILDVGAWIGPLTFLFSHLVGKTGRVYALEPMPKSFSLLEDYTINNNMGNIHLYNIAVSNVVKYVTLYSPSQISDMATTLRPHSLVNPKIEETEYKLQRKCKCTTIDNFCSSQEVHPDGIKIDVEGAEGDVLEGAIKTIEKYHPWCLLEFHGHLISKSARQRTWSLIADRAKKILYIEGDEKDLTYKMQLPPNFQPTKRSNYCVFFYPFPN
jgi:FkbM family methyltransferase